MRLRVLEAVAIRHCAAFSRDPRGLTEGERHDAVQVFGPALDPTPVRIVRASIFATPMALGNVIRIPREYDLDRATLIHELAHVWQYQTRGPEYISNSVKHQCLAWPATGSRGAAYRLDDDDLAAASSLDLPAEKQAVVVERWYANPIVRDHASFRRFLSQVRQPPGARFS